MPKRWNYSREPCIGRPSYGGSRRFRREPSVRFPCETGYIRAHHDGVLLLARLTAGIDGKPASIPEPLGLYGPLIAVGH